MRRANRWLVAGLTALALLGKVVAQEFLPTRPSSETNRMRRRIRYRWQEARGVVRPLADSAVVTALRATTSVVPIMLTTIAPTLRSNPEIEKKRRQPTAHSGPPAVSRHPSTLADAARNARIGNHSPASAAMSSTVDMRVV
jgi:hypothetical protein